MQEHESSENIMSFMTQTERSYAENEVLVSVTRQSGQYFVEYTAAGTGERLYEQVLGSVGVIDDMDDGDSCIDALGIAAERGYVVCGEIQFRHVVSVG